MNLIEGLYYIGYLIKKHQDLKHRNRLPCRVISIGNITVGGTGKTPAAVAIAEEARKRGLVPGILTRGYKGKIKSPCFVSKGDQPLLNEEEAGDEPILMAERLKGVPIVKGADRYDAGRFALNSLPLPLRPDTFILDDGFQHWKLVRDKDILLIDGTNPFGNRRLLPVGPLREPLHSIGRADIIVITKMVLSQKSMDLPTIPSSSMGNSKGAGGRDHQLNNSLIEEIRRHNTKAPIFFAEHRPAKFIMLSGEIFPLEWAIDKRFLGFCGIGNPKSFKMTLRTAGLDLNGFKSYRDHYKYNAGDLRTIVEDAKKNNADWIVTTEKDIMRLRRLSIPANLVALAIEFVVDKGFYEEVFKQ